MLKSIHWNKITFDVLCIETERGNRPPVYEALMIGFMKEKGYIAHTEQKGRNMCKFSVIRMTCFKCSSHFPSPSLISKIMLFVYELITNESGFIRDGFVPSVRPGASPDCYLGALQKTECHHDKSFISTFQDVIIS